MVGGGILVHGLPHSHDLLHWAETLPQGIPAVGSLLSALAPTLVNALAGLLAGALALGAVSLLTPLWRRLRRPAAG
jgi:predicted DNA repair protein MutK